MGGVPLDLAPDDVTSAKMAALVSLCNFGFAVMKRNAAKFCLDLCGAVPAHGSVLTRPATSRKTKAKAKFSYNVSPFYF